MNIVSKSGFKNFFFLIFEVSRIYLRDRVGFPTCLDLHMHCCWFFSYLFLSSGGWVKIQLKLCFVLFVLFFVCLFVCLFVCACLFVGSLVYHFAGLFLFCNFVSSGEG